MSIIYGTSASTLKSNLPPVEELGSCRHDPAFSGVYDASMLSTLAHYRSVIQHLETDLNQKTGQIASLQARVIKMGREMCDNQPRNSMVINNIVEQLTHGELTSRDVEAYRNVGGRIALRWAEDPIEAYDRAMKVC